MSTANVVTPLIIDYQMGMIVTISRGVLAGIVQHAEGASGRECCGLLFGTDGAITARTAAPNVDPNPERFFEIDAARLIAAEKSARQGGPQLIGYYHSHPNGLSAPSATDAARAAPDGRLWLIVAPRHVSLWRSIADGKVHGRFDPLTLLVSDVMQP